MVGKAAVGALQRGTERRDLARLTAPEHGHLRRLASGDAGCIEGNASRVDWGRWCVAVQYNVDPRGGGDDVDQGSGDEGSCKLT